MGKERSYFILCNKRLYYDREKSEMIEKPLLLYEDGTLGINSVAEFKDYTLDKTWNLNYDFIKGYMEKRGRLTCDLRDDFWPSDKPLTVVDVLERGSRDKQYFSRLELEEMLIHRRVELAIYNARAQAGRRLSRRRTQAMKRRTLKDVQFLRKLGFELTSKQE